MNQDAINDLVGLLKAYNRAYRQGAPMVSDAEYDAVVEQLRSRAPDHPFLQAVQGQRIQQQQYHAFGRTAPRFKDFRA